MKNYIKWMPFPETGSLAKEPARATLASAGYDIAPVESGVILPGHRRAIKTGLGIKSDLTGWYLQLFPKSGHAFKFGIQVLAGVIDADYKGEIKVILYNSGTEPFHFSPEKGICQAILLMHGTMLNEITPDSVREGGFGSTGK